jgi:hypothetical protein
VDEAQALLIIKFCKEDQLKAVEEHVWLLATDPPMAIISRLIYTFKTVFKYGQKPKESLKLL